MRSGDETKSKTYLSNIFSRNDAELVGILVVLDHVGQQGHHVHGESQALRRIDNREVQQECETGQSLGVINSNY
jgi:hypothetical protein